VPSAADDHSSRPPPHWVWWAPAAGEPAHPQHNPYPTTAPSDTRATCNHTTEELETTQSPQAIQIKHPAAHALNNVTQSHTSHRHTHSEPKGQQTSCTKVHTVPFDVDPMTCTRR